MLYEIKIPDRKQLPVAGIPLLNLQKLKMGQESTQTYNNATVASQAEKVEKVEKKIENLFSGSIANKSNMFSMYSGVSKNKCTNGAGGTTTVKEHTETSIKAMDYSPLLNVYGSSASSKFVVH